MEVPTENGEAAARPHGRGVEVTRAGYGATAGEPTGEHAAARRRRRRCLQAVTFAAVLSLVVLLAASADRRRGGGGGEGGGGEGEPFVREDEEERVSDARWRH